MNLTNEESDLTRWIDGELSEEQAARLLAEHPEWRDQRDTALALGEQLRDAVTLERELPYVDFFHHQIRRRIEGDIFSDEAPERHPPVVVEEEGAYRAPLFQRLRWLSAAGFVVTFGALVAFVLNQSPADRSEVVSTYTPNPEVSVVTSYHPGAEATIIQLIGAPDLPANAPALSLPQTLDRVLFQIDSRELGLPVSVLSGESDQMPGAVLVGS